MANEKRSQEHEQHEEHETVFRGRKIRIERATGVRAQSRLFIDDEEVPIEESESGVIGHEMAFKEYGSLEELAEDIIRQRGTAHIEKGENDHPHHS
jgi:hypothetical protein